MQLRQLKMILSNPSHQPRLAGLALALLLAGNAAATTYTNTVTGNWSVATSWGGSPPPAAGGAFDTIIQFSPSGTDNSTNNLTGPSTFFLNQLWLTTAQLVTNTAPGGSLLLFTNNGATLPLINNSSNKTLAINSAVVVATNLTVTAASGGGVILGGNLTEGGTGSSLSKSGAGTLTLSGANTYAGGTILYAGTTVISADNNLGNATNGLTFGGSANLQLAAAMVAARPLALNSGTATILLGAANANYNNSGQVTGGGNLLFTLANGGNGTGTLGNPTNNFTGFVGLDAAGTGQNIALTLASLADGAGYGNVRFGTGGGTETFTYSGSTPLTLNNRQIEFFNNGAAGATLTSATTNLNVNTSLAVTGTGTKTLTLDAPAGVTSTFTGNLGNGSGTVAINKTSPGTWALGGTNTYSGATAVNAGGGTLVIQGSPALSPSTAVTLNQIGGSASSLTVLDDGSGIISLPNTLYLNQNNPSMGMTLSVGNNNAANGGSSSGTTTGSTIAFNKLSLINPSSAVAQVGLAGIYGTNGYRLQFNSVDLPAFPGSFGMWTWTAWLIPVSANVTIAGSIQQLAGTTDTNGTVPVLDLDGTTSSNLISGNIYDAADLLSNTNVLPLAVLKSGTGTWSLAGTNTYGGSTTISGGTLIVNNLASGGTPSSIGQSASAADNLVLGGGTLKYAPIAGVGGAGATIDRNFDLTASTAIDASGTGALVFKAPAGNVISPDSLGVSGYWTTGTRTVNLYSPDTNLVVGMSVYCSPGITGGQTIAAINPGGTQLTLSGNATQTGNGGINFGYSTRTLTLTGTNTGYNTLAGNLQDSALGNPLSLTKTNVGTWVLAGTNTYSGVTTVSGGTLLVNGNAAGVTNTVTVTNGASFGGTGSIGGVVRYKSGALATFTVTPEASDAYSNSTYLTFLTNVLMTNVTVHVAVPDGLGNGTYVLATNAGTFTLSGTLTLAAPDAGSYGAGATTTVNVSGNNLVLTVNNASPATPVITGSTNFLNTFTTTYGTPSAAQSFAVAGSNLWVNMLNTAASGFEVSLDGATYGSTAILTNVGGNAGGTVYVRLAATAPAGSYNGLNAVTVTSAGAVSTGAASSSSGNVVAPAIPTVVVTGYNLTYNGSAHAATYTLTGVNGETGATVGTMDVSATVHTNAGTYGGDPWSFSGSNYQSTNGTVDNAIAQATPTVTVTGYSVPYDTAAHTATYTINGVNGETGATVGTMDVSATTHTNAGVYGGDAWAFTGSINYTSTNGTVDDEITPGGAVIYTNVSSGNWSAAGSWANGNNPPAGGLGGAVIQFSPNATDNSVNDLGNAFQINQLLLATPQVVNLSGNSLLFTNSGAALPQINNSGTKTLTINAAITLATNLTFSIGAGAGAVTLTNPLTDGGTGASLTLNGAGTLTLATSNNYSGGTFINGGNVVNVAAKSFGTGAITIGGNVTWQAGYGLNPLLTNSLTVSNGATLNFSHPSSYFSETMGGPVGGGGMIAAAGSQGTGTYLTLSNPSNTFTGTLYDPTGTAMIGGFLVNSLGDGGQIQLGDASASVTAIFSLNSGTAAPLVFNTRQINLIGSYGATIANNNSSATNSITINTPLLVSSVGNKTLTLSAVAGPTNIWSGILADGNLGGTNSGVISLTKSGSGLWVLAGTNTYSGSTIISTGTLTIGGTGTLGGGNYAGAITNNGTFNYASSATQILTGNLYGTGPLNQTGPGQLLVNGNAAGLTNVVTVANNATFGGVGIIGGKVVYQNGARAVFTVTPEGNDTYSNSTYLTFTNSVFMTNVTVAVTMPVGLLNGTYVLATNYAAWITNGSFNFATNSGSLGTGGSGAVSVSGNNLILTVTGVSALAGYPRITGYTNFANPFTATYGTPSAAQTYVVTGANLRSNITNTAAPGFEVSGDGGVTYGRTALVTNVSGSASNTVFIRLAATALVGTYNSSNLVVVSTLPAYGNLNFTNTTSASGNVVYQLPTSYWTANTSGLWSTLTNWSGGGPPFVTGLAIFTNTTAAYAPSVFSSNAVGALVFSNATTFGAGNSTLSLSNAFAGSAGIFVDANAGAVDLGGVNLALLANQSWINNSASNLTLSGAIASAGFIITNNGTGVGAITQSGVLSGTGGVVVNSGTLKLNGANTFTGILTYYTDPNTYVTTITTNTGGVTLNGGLLSLGHAQALGNGAPVTINGGILDASANLTLVNSGLEFWDGDFTFAGTASLNLGTNAVNLGDNRTITVNSNTLTVAGQLNDYLDGIDWYGDQGYYGVTVNGSGRLVLAAANDFYGGIVVNYPATLVASAAGALGSGFQSVTLNGGILDLKSAAGISFANGLQVNSNSTVVCELNSPGAGVNYTLLGLNMNPGTNTLTVAGGNVSSGAPGLTFKGILFLHDASTLNITNPVGGGTTVLLSQNVVQLYNYNLTLTGNGVVDFHSGNCFVDDNGGSGGGITVNMTNGGYLMLGWQYTAPNHTYTGPTILNSGAIWHNGNLPRGSNLQINGGYLHAYYGGSFTNTLGTGAGQVQILGGVSGWSVAGSGYTITLNNNANSMVQWGSAYFNPAALLLQSSIGGGVLYFQNPIDLNGTNRTVRVDGAFGSVASYLSGAISNSTGTAGLIKAGVGTLILSATNTYNGLTTISNGVLNLSNGTALQNSALDCANSIAGNAVNGLQFTNGKALTVGGLVGNQNLAALFTTASGGYGGITNLTLNPGAGTTNFYSGALADGAAGMRLAQTGLGRQILAGTNTYSGPTTVSAGTLLINGNSTGVTNTLTVATNATFGGTGRLGGKVTYQNGAVALFTLTPEAGDTYSNSTYMTFTNSLVFATNTIVKVDMPVGLGNGVYVLATNYVTPTINGSLIFATNSGSLATNRVGSISVSGKNLILNVSQTGINAYLANLLVSAGTLTPSFSSNQFAYSASVPYTVTNLTLTPSAADSNATIKINGITVVSGSPSGAIALSLGSNLITTVVVSQDSSVTNIYTLTVTRSVASSNAYLTNLVASAGTLSPAFTSNVFSYTASVTYATASLTVTPTSAAGGATIKVNGSPVVSGNPSGVISLNPGTNLITTTVVAEDLSATNTYSLTVTRAVGGTNAYLTNLVASLGALTPAFASNTFSYTASVPFTNNSLTLTPTAADTNASITVNGSPVASGNPSGSISLNVGTNLVTTVVVAQDLSATNSYSLTVTRAASISLWWDGGAANITTNGDGVSAGGTGTWNTTITNWDQGSGLSHVAWNNANTNIAIFAGTAGTATVTADVMVGGLNVSAADTIAAAGPSLIFPAGGVISNSAAVTISASMAGAGAITKTGGSTLTLNNTINTYALGVANQFAGVTTISASTIKLNDAFVGTKVAYGFQKSVYDTTGSTGAIGLDLTGVNDGSGNCTVWLGGLAGNVNLATAITAYSTLGALVLNPQTGTSATYAGIITNGATGMTLTKNGPGIQTLTGTNLYTGATTINAGTLVLSGASASLTNSTTAVRGGILSLDNSGGTWVNRVSDSAPLNLGSLILNSYNGAGVQSETVGATTNAVGGKVTIVNGTNAGDQTTLALGAVTRLAGAAVDFVGVNGILGGGANSPNVTSTAAFPGVTNGILPWATVNSTNWAITNANGIVAYSGPFVNPTTFASAATTNAQLTGSGTISSAKSFNSLNVASSSGSAQTLTLGGNLTLASGGILKSGSDAWTIGGSSTLAGGSANELIAHVDGGDLTISAPLNPAIVNIAKGGTGNLILSGTRAATLSGSVSIANGTLQFQGLNTTISGLMSGAGGLTCNLNSGQTLTINNSGNNFTGPMLVNGGMLAAGNAYNNIGAPGGVSSVGGLANIAINGTNSAATLGVAYYFGRYLGTGPDQFQITGGTSGFTAIGNFQPLYINGSASYEVMWGGTYFNPATLVLNDTPAAVAFTFQNPLNLNGTNRTIAVNSTTYAATISGAIVDRMGGAGLIKTGPGTLTLSAINTYNGATVISAGTLAMSGTGSFAGSANIVVASNAIFNVSGLSSAFTLGGSQTLSNSAPGAILNGTNNCSAGTLSLVYDGVNPCWVLTNGGMTLSAATTFQINNTGMPLAAGSYTLITNTTAGNAGYVAGYVAGAVNVNGAGSVGAATLSVSGNKLILNVSSATPTITGSTNFVNAFSATHGIASTAQTYPVTGINLHSSITNTAAPGFEVSSDGGVTYGSTAIVTNVSGSASGTVYIRLAATAPVGTYNSSNIVVLTSAGATSITNTSSASGNAVTAAVPGNFSGISVSGTALTLNVTNGTPGGAWTLLQSTNLTTPISQWQTNRTGTYDGSGNLTTNIVNTATNPAAFYLLK